MDAQLKLPKLFIACIAGICILPFLLNLLGFDFGLEKIPSLKDFHLLEDG